MSKTTDVAVAGSPPPDPAFPAPVSLITAAQRLAEQRVRVELIGQNEDGVLVWLPAGGEFSGVESAAICFQLGTDGWSVFAGPNMIVGWKTEPVRDDGTSAHDAVRRAYADEAITYSGLWPFGRHNIDRLGAHTDPQASFWAVACTMHSGEVLVIKLSSEAKPPAIMRELLVTAVQGWADAQLPEGTEAKVSLTDGYLTVAGSFGEACLARLLWVIMDLLGRSCAKESQFIPRTFVPRLR